MKRIEKLQPSAQSFLQEIQVKSTKRIYHPTVLAYFDTYVQSELLTNTCVLLASLSPDAQVALSQILITHVHKEKPIFIAMIGNSLHIPKEQTASIAMAVDLLWAISLMYDDMFDSDTVRAGIPTTWSIYGKEKTIAICQEIFQSILTNLAHTTTPEIANLAQIFVQRGLDSLGSHQAISLTASKEQLYENYHDRNDFNGTFGMQALFAVAETKNDGQVSQATLFIRSLNLASQILNDLKDVDDKYNRGYSDIRNGAVTVPLTDLYDVLSSVEKEKFKLIFGTKQNLSETDVQFISMVIAKYKILDKTIQRIKDYYLVAEETARLLFSEEDFVFVKKWIEYKKESLLKYV